MANRERSRIRASFGMRRGMKLAINMLEALEQESASEDGRYSLSDVCQLESKYRGGMPFRNIVHEKLEAARKFGTEVEEGFCAVLSHVVAMNSMGSDTLSNEMEAIIPQEVVNG